MARTSYNPRPFKVFTRESNASGVADQWEKQYAGHMRATPGGDKAETLGKLRALGTTPTADAVDAVIGNTSWTTTRCDHCGSQNVPVVVVGQEPAYESSTARICAKCLRGALRALRAPR